MDLGMSEPARLLLLSNLLCSEGIISSNGSAFLKEMILRRDPRLGSLLSRFEGKAVVDSAFMDEVHNIIVDEAQSAYDELFQDTSLEVGKSVSKEERERHNLSQEKSLIYGEVEFKSFYRILRKIGPKRESTFYDLGSGTGKALFVARFTQDFGKCIGIEILQGLHNRAFSITHRYNTEFRSILCSTQRQHAAVYNGSFLELDWSNGDVVFANSTCFDDDLMRSLSEKAEQLKPGAIVVTFTKGLAPARCFELLERKKEMMSWGPATVYIHRRLNIDGTSTGSKSLKTFPSDDQE